MKKFAKSLIALSLIYTTMFVMSCADDEPGCGGFSSKFRVTDMNFDRAKLLSENDLFNATSFHPEDTITYDSLILSAEMEFETIALRQTGSFTSTAYACSPPLPSEAQDTITSIEVFAVVQTEQGTFEVQEEVTASFDITSYNDDVGFSQKTSLEAFNQANNPAGLYYFFQLNEAPAEVTQVGYKVIFNFSTRASLEASSRITYLSPG